MTEELIRRLRAAGCETLSLEATDAGRPLYERLGFRMTTCYHQLEAGHLAEPPATPAGTRVRRLEPTDIPDVSELDRQATGEDRRVPLAALAESGGWILEDDSAGPRPDPNAAAPRGLRGFLLPAERSYGAVIAPRFEDGLFLLDLHRSIVPGDGHVRAGIPHEHEAGWRELEARGWRETWRAPRFLLGPEPAWRPAWIWGQVNSAMG
jgi:hypothetical protein